MTSRSTAARCVMALDQGTTSSRAILFDPLGRPLAVAQQEFPQHTRSTAGTTASGQSADLSIVEHDPEDIWNSQLACGRAVLEKAGLAAGDVAAIGITNQRETAILWDRQTGEPVHNAIVWQDTRT
ncbi:MAG: FGGY family carbohydrate kinase, partial [Planctomycetota bacterium]|nr:FGGY family carbohydrate kinase [Planctomycetota bacterium]